MIYAATGHRPDKLGGYSDQAHTRLVNFAKTVLSPLKAASGPGRIVQAISGMAIGWDTAFAEAALELQIPLVCAVPFKGQESIWPAESQKRYHDILRRADRVQYLAAPGYQKWKVHNRNFWMCNQADKVLALFNGTSATGTANCVKQAEALGKEVIHLWDDWEAF